MKRWYADRYVVERRFGLGILLIASAYVAAVAAFFSALDTVLHLTYPYDFVYVVGLTVTVALGQVAIPKARPQLVSMLLGALFTVVWAMSMHYWMGHFLNAALLYTAMPYALLGALAGYCTGVIAASMFLLSDLLNALWGGKELAEDEGASPFDRGD